MGSFTHGCLDPDPDETNADPHSATPIYSQESGSTVSRIVHTVLIQFKTSTHSNRTPSSTADGHTESDTDISGYFDVLYPLAFLSTEKGGLGIFHGACMVTAGQL
jgi:hypothetical protein